MNPFEDFFHNHDHALMHKWNSYFVAYNKHLSKFIGAYPRILHLGADQGAIQMLDHVFEGKAQIFVIDPRPLVQNLASSNVTTIVGSEGDKNFLLTIKNKIGPLDIIIDAGCHHVVNQTVNLKTLLPWLNHGGVYLVEATHTSYWPAYGGSVNGANTFLEHAKKLIDTVHAEHSYSVHALNGDKIPPSTLATRIESITFYDSILAIEICKNSDKNVDIVRGNGLAPTRNRELVSRNNVEFDPRTEIPDLIEKQDLDESILQDLDALEALDQQALEEIITGENTEVIKKKKKGLKALIGKLKRRSKRKVEDTNTA